MKSKSLYLFVIVVVLLGACHKAMVPTLSAGRHYNVSGVGADSAVAAMVAPYKVQMDAQMLKTIGSTDTVLYKMQPECTLGNFIADAMLQKARELDNDIDAAVMNYGGIRISYIQPGSITVKHMYELMPFDNMLCIVSMNGATLQQFCSHMASAKGWPVSGLRYSITPDKKAAGITINNIPIQDGRVYKIVTNDYVANGGDKCDFLKPLEKEQTNIFIRDVLIAYVKSMHGKPLHPYTEKRVSYAE